MFRPLLVAGALLLSPVVIAENQPRVISDDIFVYLLNGPGTEYRILGSITAGTPVTFTGEISGDYARISDHRGRDGWVLKSSLSSEKSIRQKLAETEQALNESRAELASFNEQYSDTAGTINALKDQLAKADELVRAATEGKVAAEAARDAAIAKIQSAEEEKRYQFWKEGGLIAAVGALIGIILVYLPRPQRRSRKRWMN